MRVCTSCRRLLKADAQHCPDDRAPAETVAELSAGHRLGGYKIERVLGEGGMGFVYEATHETLNRRTAIKMLRPELASHDQIVTRFLNEAKAVNLINHQNIVNVYDYGDNQDGSVYFIMEYLEGETLDDLMRKRHQMQLPLFLHVFGQVAKALAAAHAKQIVHRDLKPANVFVTPREDNPFFIKLLDFGIAQLRGAGAVQGLTLVGSVMGTPQYMSPEQVSGGTVDARSDVWAMGVMMYRAVTGEAPFKGEEFVQIADQILHHAPRPAMELVPVPPALSALIMSCLERKVEARCQSINDLIAGLERIKQQSQLTDATILATVRKDPGTLSQTRPGRNRAPTRTVIRDSSPVYQGVPAQIAERRGASAAGPRRSRLGLYLAAGALVGALGSAAFALRGREPVVSDESKQGSAGPNPTIGSTAEKPAPQKAAPETPTGPSIKDLVAKGDLAGAKALARVNLQTVFESSNLMDQNLAVDALDRARMAASAPLLYIALKKSTQVRKLAAEALGALALPDAGPKVRTAFTESAEKIKVDLAAAMYRLGDKDGREPLLAALTDAAQPAQQLIAARALADAGDDAGRAVLADVAQAMQSGHGDQWRTATVGLAKLGDAKAHKRLSAELARPEPERALGAAEALAKLDDKPARELLARVLADPEHAKRGVAGAALARLGDKRALEWVREGLASADASQRLDALAICGALAADAATHTMSIATLATDDTELSVRMTAEAVLLGL